MGKLKAVSLFSCGLWCFAVLLGMWQVFLGEYPSLCVSSMHAVRTQCKNSPKLNDGRQVRNSGFKVYQKWPKNWQVGVSRMTKEGGIRTHLDVHKHLGALCISTQLVAASTLLGGQQRPKSAPPPPCFPPPLAYPAPFV